MWVTVGVPHEELNIQTHEAGACLNKLSFKDHKSSLFFCWKNDSGNWFLSFMASLNVLSYRNKLYYRRKRLNILRRLTPISKHFTRWVDFWLGRSEIICPWWQIPLAYAQKKKPLSALNIRLNVWFCLCPHFLIRMTLKHLSVHASLQLIDGADDSPTWQLKESRQACGTCLPHLRPCDTVLLLWDNRALWASMIVPPPKSHVLLLTFSFTSGANVSHWQLI